jgi:hypothetical protein
MKVRINHAIELKEIPQVLGEMVSEIRSEISKAEQEAVKGAEAIAWLKLSSESPLKYKLLKQSLVTIKEMINEASLSIDDMLSILEGYIGLLEPSPTTPVPAQHPEQPKDTEVPSKPTSDS